MMHNSAFARLKIVCFQLAGKRPRSQERCGGLRAAPERDGTRQQMAMSQYIEMENETSMQIG
jgi:hypothetical protein